MLATSAHLLASSQSLSTTPQPLVEQQRQQERERALREQNERQVDERLSAPVADILARLPNGESPCFRIDHVVLVGDASDSFQWAVAPEVLAGMPGDDPPLGRCLGAAGINVVLDRIQARIIEGGWPTTRVLAGAQDLAVGTLSVTLVPGRISGIRLATDSSAGPAGEAALLRTAIPALPGDLLNLRAVEQGLENLRRAPTATAEVQIEAPASPAAMPGASDLLVKYVQAKPWRLSFSADDSGTQATGRYQTGVTASLDSPLGLNDLFYANANHSVGGHAFDDPDKGTEGQTMHYSVPYGWWLLGTTVSSSRYFQTVAGYSQEYVYAGKTRNAELKLARLLWRDQHRKTAASLKAWRRESRSFVDDTETEDLHQVVGGWELGLNHREFFDTTAGAGTLEATLGYRRGTGSFGSRRTPGEAFDEGTSRMKLYTAEMSLSAPFKVGGQALRYSGIVRAQWNGTPLVPQDFFAVGGRYTVRGFDGETSLQAERGWLVRNDVGWGIPGLGERGSAELYAGLDYGHVGGPGTRYLAGNHLAGAVLGLRGAWGLLSYDVFVGAPVWKPEGYRTARVTTGFSLSASF